MSRPEPSTIASTIASTREEGDGGGCRGLTSTRTRHQNGNKAAAADGVPRLGASVPEARGRASGMPGRPGTRPAPWPSARRLGNHGVDLANAPG